jgi:hypothetical protein
MIISVKRVVWTAAALAVVIGGFVWMAVTFSVTTFLLISVFGVVMFMISRWRFGGELGLFGRKEETWEAAPSWSPPATGERVRLREPWVFVATVVVIVLVVAAIAVVVLSRGEDEPFHKPLRTHAT